MAEKRCRGGTCGADPFGGLPGSTIGLTNYSLTALFLFSIFFLGEKYRWSEVSKVMCAKNWTTYIRCRDWLHIIYCILCWDPVCYARYCGPLGWVSFEYLVPPATPEPLCGPPSGRSRTVRFVHCIRLWHKLRAARSSTQSRGREWFCRFNDARIQTSCF